MAKKQANYRLDESLLNALSDRANSEGLKATDIVEKALQLYLGFTIQNPIQDDSNLDERITALLDERIAKFRDETIEINQISVDKAIAPLIARIENLESEAVSEKAPEVVGKSEGDRAEKSIAGSLDSDFSERPHAEVSDITDLPIEKALPDMTSSKAIAKTKLTYRFHPDGSIILKSIKGIDLKTFKRLDDNELEALGLYRDESGLRSKFFEIQEDRREGKIRQAKEIAEAKTKTLSYNVNKKDGSISTRTITGISIANLKKLDNQELKALGIRKKLVDGVWKFFPVEP